MKRIIDGKTYNTDTSTLIASAPTSPLHHGEFNQLFRTRHGAYFVHEGDYGIATDDPYGYPVAIKPLSPDEARLWMEQHAWAELIEEHFGEQPEAGEAESRITIRVPDTLKKRMDAAATAGKVSLNTWAIRCFEEAATKAEGR